MRNFNDWKKDNVKALKELNISEDEKQESDLPFHTLEVSNYPVWIGKNAKSNDKLVQMAHKEDIWLHARKVAGSHALIRMGNDKGMPPKSVILEVASFAAYNSKAKGAEVVPVIVTKKNTFGSQKELLLGRCLWIRKKLNLLVLKDLRDE